MHDEPILERYVRDNDLAERLSVSRSTIWRWSAEGLLPPPRRIGGATRWPLHASLRAIAGEG